MKNEHPRARGKSRPGVRADIKGTRLGRKGRDDKTGAKVQLWGYVRRHSAYPFWPNVIVRIEGADGDNRAARARAVLLAPAGCSCGVDHVDGGRVWAVLSCGVPDEHNMPGALQHWAVDDMPIPVLEATLDAADTAVVHPPLSAELPRRAGLVLGDRATLVHE